MLALLVLVQAPRLLMTPALTALGRPRAALIGLAVELAVVLGLLVATGARGLWWAVAIWVLRELASAPVMITLVKRTIGLGAAAHLRAAGGPLLASAWMAVAVIATRQWLLPPLPAAARMAVLIPVGAAMFLAASWYLDREAIQRLLAFVTSVARPAPVLPPVERRPALETE